MDTEFFYEDIKKLINYKEQNLDLIMLPKVNSEKDVIKLEKIVSQIEKRKKNKKNWI